MARGNPSLAVFVLARQAARKAVKRQLQARGLKPQYMSARDISVLADEYLAEHRELITEAKATVAQWQAEGVFGPRGGIRNPPRARAKIGSEINERSIGLPDIQ
jgi:hypothetical protein